MEIGGFPAWQTAVLSGVIGWVFISSLLGLTQRIRTLTQPWVTRRVTDGVPLVLRIQSVQHVFLDALFSILSCVVSVPFYTGFLPLLFWSGHSKLARQMTLLMAFCDYVGNSIKYQHPDLAPPPIRRVTATKDEKENAMEYGLPSSHALNTVCLSGYLLHYFLNSGVERDGGEVFLAYALVFLLVASIGIGRIYLGMHSTIDVVAGVLFGVVILAFWLTLHGYIDQFVVSGKNVTSFWGSLSVLLCFAYPTPEFPTPSFEYHTAFNGVAFGIVSGVQQTYHLFHSENVPQLFSPELPLPVFLGRMLIGIPTILVVKFCSKALAKWLLPVVCSTLGIPIRSSYYIPSLQVLDGNKIKPDSKPVGYLQRVVSVMPQSSYDVDTGIRFLQYAGLAWSVVDFVPSLFNHLRV